MERTNWKKSWPFWLLLAMVLAYFALICAVNFFAPPSFYDSDMYTDMRYAQEMWKHKSIFPAGWVFGNQLYAVSTPVVAGLFYGLIRNPVLAMGLASTVLAALVLLSFEWMLRPVVSSREGRMAGVLAFLWMVLFFGDSWHSTDGWQLLFTMCSYYASYALCAFLAYGCYLRCEDLHERRYQIILAVTCFLSFGLGIQSPRQTAVMTLPLMAVECLSILKRLIQRSKNVVKNPTFLVTVLISAANFAGLIAAKYFHREQVQIIGELYLGIPSDFVAHLRYCIVRAMSLVFHNDPVSIAALAVLVLICYPMGFWILICGIRSWAKKTENEGYDKALTLFLLLLFGVLSVIAVDFLTTLEVRTIYYFMIYPLLAFLVSWAYPSGQDWKRFSMVALLAAAFVMSVVKESPNVIPDFQNRKQDSAYAICDYMQENGYTTVYAGWNEGVNVAVASDWKIAAGFWESQSDPFVYFKYLCNPEIFLVENDKCVYLFTGEESVNLALKKAKTKNISMTMLQYFPQGDNYLFAASENIMAAFGE